jgi:urease accessory protein
MPQTQALLDQRSRGAVDIRMERGGPVVLREEGSAKCRLPRGSSEVILINTSGGLAGGDRVDISASAGARATLALTTQAAERVYRTLGPAAEVSVALTAESNSTLFWLPHETLLFDGSALARHLTADVAADATFLAVEAVVFGRQAAGEEMHSISLRDRWTIRRAGRLIHAEALALGPAWRPSPATLAGARATATLLLVSPQAETLLERVRTRLGPQDGASAWNGKLIARLLADDSLMLRKTLVSVLSACMGTLALPKVWTL